MKIKLIIILFGISCLIFPAGLMEVEGLPIGSIGKGIIKVCREVCPDAGFEQAGKAGARSAQMDKGRTPDKIREQQEQREKGGGCLIATAAFGSEMAPQVQFLRELRDNTVLQTESGTSFMTSFNQFYYSFSPVIADYERENPAFKEAVKITLTPLLTSLTLLQYADIDSESEMLGYGIGIILLNIGMYFVVPAILVMKVRKKI